MTTQRRPHWDDDLIDAVFRALSHTYRAQGWAGGIAIDLDESVYPLIAAVEDWVLSAPIFDLYLSRKHAPDKAAIARVRQVLDAEQRRYNPPLGLISRIRNALDGGDS